jgi:hypothetical protein
VRATDRAGLPRLWIFNLDAEIELSRSGPYQATAKVLRALGPLESRARALMQPGDRALGDPADGPRRELGACWSPTPSALRRLSKAGAELGPTPGEAVLRRVCQRKFYHELGAGAPGAVYVDGESALARVLAQTDRRDWLFKRAFGFAGRGQRRIQGQPSADDRRWLSDSLARGGLLAEPWLHIERELCQHGFIDLGGQLTLGQVCVQWTDARRVWLRTSRAAVEDVESSERKALEQSAVAASSALWSAGYWGPFGIDAYRFRSASGALAFNPFGELNARYTMGYAIGFSPVPRY